MVSQDLWSKEQCISARNRANRVLGFITRSIRNRSDLALVRHHLDYAEQFWSLYYRIQRRMTKMIQGIRNLTYKDRLKHLNLYSLERRRVRRDLIEVFKWIKGYNKEDINKVLIVKEKIRTLTKGFKLDKFRFRKDIGKNWFTNRVVEECSKLRKHMVSAGTVDTFKKR